MKKNIVIGTGLQVVDFESISEVKSKKTFKVESFLVGYPLSLDGYYEFKIEKREYTASELLEIISDTIIEKYNDIPEEDKIHTIDDFVYAGVEIDRNLAVVEIDS